jgi:phosphoribosyl 1,2-cyclic phosphodiesterase
MSKIELFSLGSGSSGNSFFIKYNDKIVLIDAGLTCKKIVEKFDEHNFSVYDIKAIVVTHTHSDHIKGIGPLVRKFGIPVYISEKSYIYAKDKLGRLNDIIFINGSFNIGDFYFEPFISPHDSIETFNFIIKINNYTISYISDTGYVTPFLLFKVKESDVLIVEANYDKMMLINNKTRPWIMKQRVLSRAGHLSNEDALSVIKNINSARLKYVFLTHLSSEHNDYNLVKDFFEKNVSSNVVITVCEQTVAKGLTIDSSELAFCSQEYLKIV